MLLRDVQRSDLKSLQKLASVLNTVNLPDDTQLLAELIDRSVRSFTEKITNPFEREYLFVLEDLQRQRVIGTSLIIAQHGTFEAPHIYYEVAEREHYSASLGLHRRHKVLSIAYNYSGPTEIGGLVVDPEFRGGVRKPGRQLSFVRFLFIALHRGLFREQMLAELLPPLLPDGRSLLWEACGKKFTGLTYQEADRLSHQNKEFIKELFPSSGIYTTLFPRKTQKVIGEVGVETKGVQQMLTRIGFQYADRIDPFDGGPHYEAKLSELSLVKQFKSAEVLEDDLTPADVDEADRTMLVAYERAGRNRFRAVRSRVNFQGTAVQLPKETKLLLQVPFGATVGLIPFG